MRTGRNCCFLERSSRAGLLIDARQYYRAFYQAALLAEHQILIAGWQFDSGVPLLRGEDVPEGDQPVGLLPFLDWLCERKPGLRIHLLAWDFSFVFLLERERMQEDIFNIREDGRLTFRFDDKLASGACQHEKLVVIDGELAFVGGIDLCDARWDDRGHLAHDPRRFNLSGDVVGPYHDVQMFYEGPVARRLGELYCKRWEVAVDEELVLASRSDWPSPDLGETVPVQPGDVAVCRTSCGLASPPVEASCEIQALYVDAIGAAENVIYIETQYLTSRAICEALVKSMLHPDRPDLQIVIILPCRAEALKEELAMGVTQTKQLRMLVDAARKAQRALGVYFTVAPDTDEEIATYIHSKVLIVDDRLMTVGSANCTNRSLCLDHELNVAWEQPPDAPPQSNDIRQSRIELLSEHCGSDAALDVATTSGLVERLDDWARRRFGRLRLHPLESTALGDNDLLRMIADVDWGLDPDLARG